MAKGPARQRLDELNSRIQKSIGSEKGSTSLPPNYSQYIKEAQAEEAASRKGAASSRVATPTSRPARGSGQSDSSGRAPQPRNVPRPTSREPDNVPVPSSGDDARTARQVDSSGAGEGILAILTAAIGGAGAYALYKRLTRGDPDAMNEAKTIMDQQGDDSAPDKEGRLATRQSTDIDPARFGDDIVDADYDVLPDQKAISSQEAVPSDPRAGDMDSYLDDILADGTDPAQIEMQKRITQESPRQLTAPAVNEDAAAQEAIESGNGPRPEVPREESVDDIIRQAIEEGRPAAKSGRVGRAVRAEVPRPKFKPRT